MRVGIAVLPYFSWLSTPSRFREIPHLGMAALVGFLKQHGISAEAIDLRNATECAFDHSINLITPKKRFVSETVTLPILLPLLDRYFGGQKADELLQFEASARAYDDYVFERNLERSLFVESVQGLHNLVKSSLQTLSAFDIIGFSVYFTNFYTVMLTCMALRLANPKLVIVVGGPEVTQSRNAALLMLFSGVVDAVIPHAGELPLLRFIQAKQRRQPIERVPGIMAVVNGRLIETPPPAFFPLEDLPLPDYSDLDLNEYLHFTYSLETSRGCPFRCKFCAEYGLLGRYQRISCSGAYQRFAKTLRAHRCHSLYCADSLLNANEKWLLELSHRLIAEGLSFSWSAYLRPTTNRKLIAALRKAGLASAFMGMESVSDRTLESMNKKSSFEESLSGIRAFIEEGIPISLGMILGYPGENENDHKKLMALLEYFYNYNADVMKTYTRSFQVMGFRGHPVQRLPLVGVTALPFFLKSPSEIYQCPDEYGIRVAPLGNRFREYKSLPGVVKNLISKIPWTFVSKGIATEKLYRRLQEVGALIQRGHFSSYAQLVHTYFSCLGESDRLSLACEGAFSVQPEKIGLTYRSTELDMDISSEHISHSCLELLKRGTTIKEFIKRCTPGTKSAAVEAKHLIAVAAAEGSLFLEQGET